MNSPTVEVGGRRGRLFEGEIPHTLCFVPEDCIQTGSDGLKILNGDYVRSGWDVRNMRFSDAPGGEHLFPIPEKPVVDLDNRDVRVFVARLRQTEAVDAV